MRAIGLLTVTNGEPTNIISGVVGQSVGAGQLLVQGYNLLYQYGDIGLYLVVATPAELQALDAATATCAGGVILDWPNVANRIPATVLTRVNAWLTARSKPTLAADMTWTRLFKQLRIDFDALFYDLDDPDPDKDLPRIKVIFVAPQVVQLSTPIAGPCYRLLTVGAYALWQVDTNAANALALHNALYAMTPASTLGALAVVDVFGQSFQAAAIRTATGMTAAQANARRNRIATYLDTLGKSTTALRAATDEHAQMLAIAAALGYTAQQVWAAMIA